LDLARHLKGQVKKGHYPPLLKGKTLAMIFEKPSNRTRVSFEVGMFQLGGMAIPIQGSEIGMGIREPIPDVSRTLCRYVDGIMIRAKSHTTLEVFAENATKPVINGLSDTFHPCQAMADIMTIQEKKKSFEKITLCYIGDGNNVCHSLMELCSLLNISMVVTCPKGYEPSIAIPPYVTLESNVKKSIQGADVVYTDVWTSMGQEEERINHLRDFKEYTVSLDLLKYAKPDVLFMHCLPAKRGEEVTDNVMESRYSVVFDQAENRLHVQKAILVTLMKEGGVYVD